MIAVDSNVVFDIITTDSRYYDESVRRLERVAQQDVVITDVVYAEIGTVAESRPALEELLQHLAFKVMRPSTDALYAASVAWRDYTRRRPEHLQYANCGASHRLPCSECGAPMRARQRMLADFIIGAHAMVDTDGLLTRDQRYFRTYFPALRLL